MAITRKEVHRLRHLGFKKSLHKAYARYLKGYKGGKLQKYLPPYTLKEYLMARGITACKVNSYL